MRIGIARSGLSIWVSGALGVVLAIAVVAGLLHLWRCGHFSPCYSYSADLGVGRSLTIAYRPTPRPARHLRIRLVLVSPTAGASEFATERSGGLPQAVEFHTLGAGKVWVLARDAQIGPVLEGAIDLRSAQCWHSGRPEALPRWATTDGGRLLARWGLLCGGEPSVYLNWERRARGTVLQDKPRLRNERHALVLRSGDVRYRDARVVPTASGAVLVRRRASGETVQCAELDRSRRVLVDADGYEWRFGPAEGDAITRSAQPVAR